MTRSRRWSSDAEANAEADKERRELVETKNQGESLLHSTKKSLAEHGDKVDPSTVEAIELAMQPLEDALKGEDAGKIQSRHPEPDRSRDEAGRGDLQGQPGRRRKAGMTMSRARWSTTTSSMPTSRIWATTSGK